MSIITQLIMGPYARWKKRLYRNSWDDDFKILLRQASLDNPFNPAGLELALLHLKKTPIQEPSIHIRRALKVYSSTTTVDQLLSLMILANSVVEAGNSMSSNFFPSEERRLHKFDDYFVSIEGHTVSIEKIVGALQLRLTELISKLEHWEVNNEVMYDYYNRRLYQLFCDSFFVLQAIHATSYH
jgi:hypothetical protein